MIPPLLSREWIAWKLVRLANRIFDATYYERIYVNNECADMVFEAVITGDRYGGGVSSMWGAGVIPGGVTIHWDEDYHPAWLDDKE